MKFDDDPISGNGYKVRLLLAHLGLPCEYVPSDILRGETRTPEFLRKNPNGRIPVLELDDGSHLAESNAILYYLVQGTPYWPSARLDRARVMQWLFFEQHSHEPNIALYADTHKAHEGGFDLARYPAVTAWLGRVSEQPSHITIDQCAVGNRARGGP